MKKTIYYLSILLLVFSSQELYSKKDGSGFIKISSINSLYYGNGFATGISACYSQRHIGQTNDYVNLFGISLGNFRMNSDNSIDFRIKLVEGGRYTDYSHLLSDSYQLCYVNFIPWISHKGNMEEMDTRRMMMELALLDYDQTGIFDLYSKWFQFRINFMNFDFLDYDDNQFLSGNTFLVPSMSFKAGLSTFSAGSPKCPIFGENIEKSIFGLETGAILNFDIYFSEFIKNNTSIDMTALISDDIYNFVNLKTEFILNSDYILNYNFDLRSSYFELTIGYELLGTYFDDWIRTQSAVNLKLNYYMNINPWM